MLVGNETNPTDQKGPFVINILEPIDFSINLRPAIQPDKQQSPTEATGQWSCISEGCLLRLARQRMVPQMCNVIG